MNKNELMSKVQIYADRTTDIIKKSNADYEAKLLVNEITDETCSFIAAIINELSKSLDF